MKTIQLYFLLKVFTEAPIGLRIGMAILFTITTIAIVRLRTVENPTWTSINLAGFLTLSTLGLYLYSLVFYVF